MIIEAGLLLGLKRHEMNIVPTSRGFVAGYLAFTFDENSPFTDCLGSILDGGLSISSSWSSTPLESIHIDVGPARCLLVIEKQVMKGPVNTVH